MEHFLQGVQFCWQMQIQTVNELKFIEQHQRPIKACGIHVSIRKRVDCVKWGLVTLNKRFFVSTPSFTVTYSLMSNEHLPSACSKIPSVLMTLVPLRYWLGFVLVFLVNFFTDLKQAQTCSRFWTLCCWGRICRFDLGDVAKRCIYINICALGIYSYTIPGCFKSWHSMMCLTSCLEWYGMTESQTPRNPSHL